MTYAGKILKSPFGAEHADCSRCEMRGSCKQRLVKGEYPEDWQPGGLMIIGEGPGKVEISLLRPFQGKSGRLLNAICEDAGIDRKKCWITNATLGLPPEGTKESSLHDNFPMAVYSCLPRLEAEISVARPRVIVTLGTAAFVALSAVEKKRDRLVPFDCNNADCDPETRKLRTKGIECAAADCTWFAITGDDADEEKLKHGGKCPGCQSSITRLRPKAIKCPTCGGKKRRVEVHTRFEHDFVLVGRNGVAGAVYRAEELPSQLQEFGVKYVIPTYHPAFCLYPAPAKTGEEKQIGGQFAARVLSEHLQKARRLLREDTQFRATPLITTDPEVIRGFVADPDAVYACDVETNSMDGAWGATKITVFGIARADQDEALVIDTRNVTDAVLDALQEFLENPKLKKRFHGGQFDRVVIRRLWGIECAGVDGDTLLEHHSLYPDEEQGLGFCAHELLDAPHWKESKRKLKPGETDDLGGYRSFEDLALYNARDTRSTALVDRIMAGPVGGRGRLDAERCRQTYELDVKMQDVSVRMELYGLPLDLERKARVQARAEAQYRLLLGEMQQMVGRTTMPKEPEVTWTPTGGELLWALYDPAGPLRLEPVAFSEKTKAPSTAKEALARMKDQHPFVEKLMEWKKYEYTLKNYIHGSALKVQADGRLHPQWKVYGTVTTRWTSTPNFQNWTKAQDSKDELLNLRSMIVAPPGRMLVGADYAQLELRVLADLCGDPELIRRITTADESRKLEPDYDPHSFMAAAVFERVWYEGDTKRKKALRDVVKRVVYGLNYGAGAATVLEAIYNGGYDGPPINLAMIQKIIEVYFKLYPGIGRWQDGQRKLAAERWEIRAPLFDTRRIFPLGDIDDTLIRNFPIQVSAANIMNSRLAVLEDGRLLSVDPTAHIIAQVHDAVYYECDEDRAEQVGKVISEALSCELSLSGETKMQYLASADADKSWANC